ncbi:restriction endonuclease subunit S [Stutzerimonas stutzeri]|uniref:restriction endonuclease subunit S n=1 Tax=Stutzerimonas stutzeri TaxID=316 RepID=UPI003C6F9379
MSGMTFLENLLEGGTVEWKPLRTLVKTVTAPSKLKSQAYCTTGSLPIIDQGIEFIAGYTDEDITPVEAGEYVIFGDHSEHIKYVDFPFVQGADGIKILSSSSANSKYIYYAFQNFYTKKLSYKRHWSVAQETYIPIPYPECPRRSLEIQAEIVRILDVFTELTAELTAELTVRKKQYNYYRDQLLSFNEGDVEWKTLGEVGKFIRGKRFTKADYVEDGISVIHYGEIYTRYGTFATRAYSQVRKDMAGMLRYAEPGDVVMAGVGETVEDVGKAVAWLGGHKVAIHDDSYAFRHSMNPKYIVYVMQTAFFNSQKTKHVSNGKVKRLLIESMKKDVHIPVPYPNDPDKSLAEQARIVSILDKFDALTHSVSEGLPREIELRQKQYEHYRDLLLNFPKPDEVAA